AAFARAPPHRPAALGHLLGDERRVAARTRLEHGLVPHHEGAVRVAVAAVERVAAARAPLVELALPAHQTFDAGRNRLEQRLDALALPIARPPQELPQPAETPP